MIENPHGKGGVEGFKVGGEVFHPNGQQVYRDITEVVLDAEELEQEQQTDWKP